MRYLTTVDGQSFQVMVEDDGRIVVGDQAFGVDLRDIDVGALFSLLIDHESYEMVVDEHQDGYRVLLWGEMYEVSVEEDRPHRARRKPRPGVSPSDECVVCAPMPGLVTQVPVSVGQQVATGEVLVILESMKMENELLAPRQGTVKTIHVTPGDTPSLDEPLVTLV
jgi:biotin carboxyl carrier protein